MRGSQIAGLVTLFVLLVLLHFFVRPLLDWRAAIDFLTIAVLLVAVRVRPGTAALVGFLAGVAADSLSPSNVGAAALALSVVGFGASWLKASFFAEHVLLNAVFLLVAKMGFDVVFLLAEQRLHGSALATQLLVWSPLSAVVTALAGLLILVVFRPLLESDERR